jgi:hypothetical protein
LADAAMALVESGPDRNRVAKRLRGAGLPAAVTANPRDWRVSENSNGEDLASKVRWDPKQTSWEEVTRRAPRERVRTFRE